MGYSIFFSLTILSLSLVSTSHAQTQAQTQAQSTVGEYLPLTGIPGVTQAVGAGKRDVPALGTFFANMFYLWVGIAGILAVIMLMWGGIQYMTSEAIGGKEAAKSRIWSAIIGLILVLMSWLIIFTINPQILNLNLAPQNTTPAGNEGNPLFNVLDPSSVPNRGLQDPGPGFDDSFFQTPQ